MELLCVEGATWWSLGATSAEWARRRTCALVDAVQSRGQRGQGGVCFTMCRGGSCDGGDRMMPSRLRLIPLASWRAKVPKLCCLLCHSASCCASVPFFCSQLCRHIIHHTSSAAAAGVHHRTRLAPWPARRAGGCLRRRALLAARTAMVLCHAVHPGLGVGCTLAFSLMASGNGAHSRCSTGTNIITCKPLTSAALAVIGCRHSSTVDAMIVGHDRLGYSRPE